MKNKEIVSEIVGDLRALNIDDRISSRYVLSKLRGYLALYIKRENDQRRLYDYDNLWLTVSCIDMVPSNSIECCGISVPKCKTWMKSKLPVPDLYLTTSGPAIKEVQSLRGDFVFDKSSPRSFEKAMKRRWKDDSTKYYWIENNHLIIPDTEVESITVSGYFKDKKKARLWSACLENECDPKDIICSLPMDEEFDCPDYLEAQIKLDTITNLFNFYKRNIVDDVPNSSTNQKSNTKS